MTLTLLASESAWHTQDLLRAARSRAIDATIADFTRLDEAFHKQSSTVIVRSMPAGSLEQVIYRMDLLHVAEQRGATIWNPPRALECCIDKYLTTARLIAAKIPTPRTWCGQTAEAAMTAFEELGGDVVVKPLFGSEGRGLIRVNHPDLAARVFAAIEQVRGVLYLQKFIDHPEGDLRAFVLGGSVLSSVRRRSQTDWRTNIALGGTAEPIDLTAEEERLAIAAAEATGCPIAGVDLIAGPGGPLVLEVNAVPGWRALSRVTGIDVAAAAIDYVCGNRR